MAERSRLLNSQRILKNFEDDPKKMDTSYRLMDRGAKSKKLGCFSKFLDNDFEIKNEYQLEAAQKWITYPGILKLSFPLQTIQPKVQMLRNVQHKRLPRDVEVDRRRRQYAKLNIVEMLKDANIQNYQIMPIEAYEQLCEKFKVNYTTLERYGFLPLNIFDNTDFAPYASSHWLKIGEVDGVFHPLPAQAFVPVQSVDTLTANFGSMEVFYQIRNELYDFKMVAVHNYDPDTMLWNIQSLENGEYNDVPRIYLRFIAENPATFVERLRFAIAEREKVEHLIKYQLVIDCLLLHPVVEMPVPLIEKIKAIVVKEKLGMNQLAVNSFLKEMISAYMRVMEIFDFEHYIQGHPTDFPHLHSIIPEKERAETEKAYSTSYYLKMMRSKDKIRVNTLFYIFASFQAMYKVNVECNVIETLALFSNAFSKPVPLSEFLSTQQYTCTSAVKYLKGFWIENMASQICICLRNVGKGWLDLTTHEWNVYFVSKIFRFLLQVKIRMETSIQIFLERAIYNYGKLLLDPCKDIIAIEENFEWTENFIQSPFPTKTTPVFYQLLQMSPTSVFYSTDPKEFKPKLLKIFYESLMHTNGARIIDYLVMTKLHFAPNLYLKTVELIEAMYLVYRDKLNVAYEKAMYPLLRYATKYNQFIPLFVLNVNEFIKELEVRRPGSTEIRNSIVYHREEKEYLRQNLPASIVIGPFFVNVDPLKHILIAKRTEIVKRIFEYYVDRMFNTTEEILDEFLAIYSKLTEQPNSIEHLLEIKDFITLVPDKVEVLQERVKIMMLEYEVLDYFFYNLSDAQFSMKWEAFGWPFKINQRLIVIKEEHKIEIEEFKRNQISEVGGFQERLESLNEEVQGFSLQFNIAKTVEYAVEIKKMWKLISEIQVYGELLQKRQIIFELEDLSLDFLNKIVASFVPYRNLWYGCADYLKLEEATIGNPLVGVEVEEVTKSLNDLEEQLKECKMVFNEKPEIAQCAEYYLQKIEDFRPVLILMDTVKHPCWLVMHWQELSQKAAIEIKFSLSMNFMYCMKKGIMEHFDLVREIGQRAIDEADAIQRAIEEEERLRKEASLLRLEKKAARKCRTDIL